MTAGLPTSPNNRKHHPITFSPLVSGQYFTVENTADFQTLLYEPLYWFGDKASTSIDYPLSIGNPPVYSDGDRVVTITLKHYVWSNGETVSARDVIFWINLLKANPDEWASYVPGGFPDNVKSATAPNATTVQLAAECRLQPDLVHLQRAVSDHASPPRLGPHVAFVAGAQARIEPFARLDAVGRRRASTTS